jgi:hypothetical protein
MYRSVDFVVVRGNSGNLLSYRSAVELGIINPILSLSAARDAYVEKLSKKFPSVFSGKIGLLKNHVVKLHIDESVKPVQQKVRHVPFHLREMVENEIKNMLEQDIIEPVTGPTPWVSPIDPIPKPNRPGEIRICTNSKAANKAIHRTRHTSPTLDDLIVKLNGAAVISKFDLKSGYNQLMVELESRYILSGSRGPKRVLLFKKGF